MQPFVLNMRTFHFLLFIAIGIVFYWIVNPYFPQNGVKPAVEEKVLIDSTVSISFSVVGDVMCHSTQYNYAWVEEDSFDFNPVFKVLGDYLREKDVLIGNLETILAGNTKDY